MMKSAKLPQTVTTLSDGKPVAHGVHPLLSCVADQVCFPVPGARADFLPLSSSGRSERAGFSGQPRAAAERSANELPKPIDVSL